MKYYKEYDLLFLDINMPDLSGLQFLKSLTEQPLVIFTTAYSQYAAESYDFQAVDYLLKPIKFERFLKAITRALKRYRAARSYDESEVSTDSILIKSGSEYHQVKLSDILYIEGTGNYITIVTPEKKILSLLRLKNVLKQLPENAFIRIHRSYIVAFQHIDVIDKNYVRINKKKLPVGELYRKDLYSFIHRIGGLF